MPRSTIAAALALTLIAALAPAAPAQVVTRNLTLEAAKHDFPPAPGTTTNYSACWSYVHSDGREYALIGVNGMSVAPAGTAIYNVTNPAATYLVTLIPGPPSTWREMKSYRDWIYVVSEGTGAGAGLQIIRMTNPEVPVLAATYTTTFLTAHTVSVDTTRGLLVCNGTQKPGVGPNGMRILALNSHGGTPEAPVEVGWWPGGSLPVSNTNYVHDSVPVGDRLYASSIYVGLQRLIDITDPAAPVEAVAPWLTPGAFTHNAWPDATGNWLYTTDEINGVPLGVYDISNLAGPQLVNAITSNPKAIVHNVHVMGSDMFLSNYTEGVRVLDISDPAHPAEFAVGDSYPGASGGYSGVWEACPFFPSGTVIASDRNTGLYVYRLVRDYGLVRAEVINGGSEPATHACGAVPGACCCAPHPCTCGATAGPGDPMPQHEVFLTVQGDSLITPLDGVVRFGPSPGTHTVLARQFGFYDASATVNVTQGSSQTVVLPVVQRPTVSFTGTLRDAVTSQPLDGAEVSLAYTPLHQHTGPTGTYALDVPGDTYLLQLRRAGYVPVVFERVIGPGFPGQDYVLTPAPVWQDLETNPGWTVGAVGDDAVEGIWTRVVPLGTGARPPAMGGPQPGARRAAGTARRAPTPLGAQHEEVDNLAIVNAAPYADHTPGVGTMCFVTGQGTDSTNIDNGDIEGGKTTLTTPAFDATSMSEPTLSFWRWFCSHWFVSTGGGTGGPDPSDYLAVLISNDNDASWTPVDTIRGVANHWTEQSVRIADYVTPTSQVRLRFVAADAGPMSIAEAAIDDLTMFDAALGAVHVPGPGVAAGLAFRAPAPNPAAGAVRLVLDLPQAGEVDVDIVDVGGRIVRDVFRGRAGPGPLSLTWDGADRSQRPAPAGLYFARARAASAIALARLVRIR